MFTGFEGFLIVHFVVGVGRKSNGRAFAISTNLPRQHAPADLGFCFGVAVNQG
jgi:hypothetical protein